MHLYPALVQRYFYFFYFLQFHVSDALNNRLRVQWVFLCLTVFFCMRFWVFFGQPVGIFALRQTIALRQASIAQFCFLFILSLCMCDADFWFSTQKDAPTTSCKDSRICIFLYKLPHWWFGLGFFRLLVFVVNWWHHRTQVE